MNRKSNKDRALIFQLLCEGNSIRDTARITNSSKNTVVRILGEVGQACLDYHDEVMVDLPCTKVQCDEIWSFVYSKAKNVPEDKQGELGYGDVWTWVAIDADSKLVPCWAVGKRDLDTAYDFMCNLAWRLKNRIQLTTDGLNKYLSAVKGAFGNDIDYAMLVKLYGRDGGKTPERKYSPAQCNGAKKLKISGSPNKADVSTSYVERQNLTMRMGMRRFTRLTNAFSKKLENHMHAISLHYMYYNFVRVHKTIKTTPAMAAGVANHRWTLEEVVEMTYGSDSK